MYRDCFGYRVSERVPTNYPLGIHYPPGAFPKTGATAWPSASFGSNRASTAATKCLLLSLTTHYNAFSKNRGLVDLNEQTRAILFDLDGTLIDTTNLILECFHHSWKTVCGFNHTREALIQTFGTPLRDAMHQLLKECQSNGHRAVEADAVEPLLTEYRLFNVANHDLLARPFTGAREVLSELRARGYKIAVVTSKSRELGLRGLKLCSLDSLIDSAVFLEDTTIHKPQPEPILKALEKLKATSASAVYVGDSRHDIIAARAAGVRAIAALWGPSPRNELEREHPDHTAEAITDLLEIFN
jgi:pyrophosphatase PpaX